MDRIHPSLPPLHTAGVHPSHWRGATFATSLVVIVYILTVIGPPPGWLTWWLCAFPIGVLTLSVISRVNDIDRSKIGAFWDVRRCGLILVSLFVANIVIGPFLPTPDFPTWWRVTGIWGFALVWLTSPHQPPWFHYVWRSRVTGVDTHPCRRATDDLDSNP